MDNRSLSHTRWKCQYHIVFIPKYRKKVLYGKAREDVREIISILCRYKNVDIIAGAVCLDHIHLSVAISPFGASSSIALMRADFKPPVELVVYDLDWSCCKIAEQSAMEQQLLLIKLDNEMR